MKAYYSDGRRRYSTGTCIVPGFHIRGVKGSAAEKYAEDNNIPLFHYDKYFPNLYSNAIIKVSLYK